MRLLGRGNGRCLDLACGTGLATEVVAELGWSVVGVDVSAELLGVARERGLEVVEGSANALPFEDEAFDAAVSVWTHTDVGGFRGTVAEVARVLRPGAPFVYIGGHPCFVGPHSLFMGAEGTPGVPSRLPAEQALRRQRARRRRPRRPARARRARHLTWRTSSPPSRLPACGSSASRRSASAAIPHLVALRARR